MGIPVARGSKLLQRERTMNAFANQPPRHAAGSARSSWSRFWPRNLLLGLLFCGLAGGAGCGGGNGGGGNGGTGPEDFDVTVNLSVQGAGNGNGQVTGSQLTCQIQNGTAAATGCQRSFTLNSRNLPTNLTLTAAAGQGSGFVAWGGACGTAGGAASCQVSVNSSSASVNLAATARFDLLPGSIEVTTTAAGSDLDPDGYGVTIGQNSMGTIGVAETRTYSDLPAGDYEVSLTGLADNCTLEGSNPRTLTVNAGATTQTTFSVTCAPITGTIEVTTVTSGDAQDLDDSYTVTVGQEGPVAMGVNATQSFAQLQPGNQTVTLGDIADNCTLDEGENPRTVAVAVGQTAQTTFNLTCGPTKGTIQVTTVTQGDAQELDPDGYTLTIDQGAATNIGINATESFTQLLPGNHSVTLGDIAGSCALTGENPRTAAVVAGETTQVTFNITCGSATGIKVTTFINGVFLPTTLTISLNGGAATSIGANATLEFSPLPPGNYDVLLGGIPKTCVAGIPNPKTIILNAGELSTVMFVLQCVPPNEIAFEQVSPRGDKDICVLDPYVEDPPVTCLTGGPGDTADDVHPVWGPNQEWIIFSSDRDGDFELYKMNADGTGVTKLTDNAFFDGDPDIYFSGVKLVFTSDRSGNKDIWEMDLTQPGNPVTRLTTDGASDFNPTYAWDSGVIMFTTNRDGDQDIWRIDGWGTVGPQTIGDDNDDDAWYMPPNLFYSSDRFGSWDIIRTPNGLPAQKWYSSTSVDKQPAPGPLGQWVAFTTNKDGNYELYMKNLASAEVIRLTTNGVADTRPAWYAWWH